MRLDRFSPVTFGYDPMTKQIVKEGYNSGVSIHGDKANPDYDIFFDGGVFIVFRTDEKSGDVFGVLLNAQGSGWLSGETAARRLGDLAKRFPQATVKVK